MSKTGSITVNKIKIPYTVEASYKYVCGDKTTFTLTQDTVPTKTDIQNGYIKAAMTNVPPVSPTNPIITPYQKTLRYQQATNAWKVSDCPVGVCKSIPAAKGGVDMVYNGVANPSLEMPYVTKEGLLVMLNQAGIKYTANIQGSMSINDPKDARYSRERHLVMFKPNYFNFEEYCVDDFGFGDLGNNQSVRCTNANDPAHMFANAVTPVDTYSYFRFRLTAISGNTSEVNVELWINGIKQTNTQQVKTWYRKNYAAVLGVDTNNSHVAWAEVFDTPVLTDAVAAQIASEVIGEYNIGKPLIAAYPTNLSTSVAGGKRTVKYTGSGTPKIQWVTWLNNNGPTESAYLTQYDNQLTVPANFEGMVLVTLDFGVPGCVRFDS